MIYIEKGKEPDSLTQHKKQAFASYDNCNKVDIREALLHEQGCLCAYCMRRISKDSMKIEHWIPESELDELGRMEYSNMLGCCEGHFEGGSHREDTCDTHKGNTRLTVTPTNAIHIDMIKYRQGTGEIYSDNQIINMDLDGTLNLNCARQYLKDNRRAALMQLQKKLNAMGTINRNKLEKLLQECMSQDADGQKMEYAGILIWYLNRKLKQHA